MIGFGILAAMVGTTILHYRITGKLGTGGMGVVYDAEDLRLSRPVALKFLSDELAGDPDATRRLQREAETLARPESPEYLHGLRGRRPRGDRLHRHGAAWTA